MEFIQFGLWSSRTNFQASWASLSLDSTVLVPFPLSCLIPFQGPHLSATLLGQAPGRQDFDWSIRLRTSYNILGKTRSRAGFLNLGMTDIWGRIILCGEGCPVHGTMCSSIPAFQLWQSEVSPDIAKCPQVKNQWPRNSTIAGFSVWTFYVYT